MKVRILRCSLFLHCLALLLYFSQDNREPLLTVTAVIVAATISFAVWFLPIVQRVEQQQAASANPWTPPRAKTDFRAAIRRRWPQLFLRPGTASANRNPNSKQPLP